MTLIGILVLAYILLVAVSSIAAQGSDPKRVMTGVRFNGSSSVVSVVVKGGPADRAGIKVGDEIISIGERFVVQANDLVLGLEGKQAGDTIVLEIRRGNGFNFFELKLINAVAGDVVIGEDGKAVNARSKPGIVDEMGPELTPSEWWGIENNESALLANNRDKVVCLLFFQTDCHYSNSEGLPILKELQEDYGDDPQVKLIALQTPFRSDDLNTLAAAKALFEEKGLKGPVGHEGNSRKKSETYINYKVPGTPWFVVMDKQGVVRYNDSSLPIEEAREMFELLKMGKTLPEKEPPVARQQTISGVDRVRQQSLRAQEEARKQEEKQEEKSENKK